METWVNASQSAFINFKNNLTYTTFLAPMWPGTCHGVSGSLVLAHSTKQAFFLTFPIKNDMAFPAPCQTVYTSAQDGCDGKGVVLTTLSRESAEG